MDISNFVTIEEIQIERESIIFSKKIQKLCSLPYGNNKNGCPRYNKSLYCPPNSPYMEKEMDNYYNFRLVIASFNLRELPTPKGVGFP